MSRKAPKVSGTELRLLQALWDHGPLPIRRLTELLYPAVTTSRYASVQKLLERLEEEELVARDRSGPSHVFSARISRDEYIGESLRAMADQLCGGSLAPLLTHLVQGESLSAAERSALRRLLETTDEPPPSDPDRT
jgi:predicted transcriptional regulator